MVELDNIYNGIVELTNTVFCTIFQRLVLDLINQLKPELIHLGFDIVSFNEKFEKH